MRGRITPENGLAGAKAQGQGRTWSGHEACCPAPIRKPRGPALPRRAVRGARSLEHQHRPRLLQGAWAHELNVKIEFCSWQLLPVPVTSPAFLIPDPWSSVPSQPFGTHLPCPLSSRHPRPPEFAVLSHFYFLDLCPPPVTLLPWHSPCCLCPHLVGLPASHQLCRVSRAQVLLSPPVLCPSRASTEVS